VHSLKEDILINDFNALVSSLRKDKDEEIQNTTKEQVDYLQKNKYNTELIEEYNKQDMFKEMRERDIYNEILRLKDVEENSKKNSKDYKKNSYDEKESFTGLENKKNSIDLKKLSNSSQNSQKNNVDKKNMNGIHLRKIGNVKSYEDRESREVIKDFKSGEPDFKIRKELN